MKSALLEIGVEHLPARFLQPALAQLEAKAAVLLKENRLSCSSLTAYGTLRRLALILKGVAVESEPVEKVVAGPPAGMLKSEDGCFTPQALGFAKAQGVRPEDLLTVSTAKGEFIQARRTLPGEPAAEVLARVFPELIRSLEFPKNMEWEESRLRFARPIRSLLALYGNRVIPFEVAGVRSGSLSPGLAIGAKPIRIAEAGTYVGRLRDECILVEIEERRKVLSKALDQAVRGAGSGVALDRDPALMEELVCLTEHPIPVVGRFDPAFLSLPQALLTLVLKKQLKFFPLLDAEGKLHPGFAGVRDGISEGQETVRDGYERVIEARFSDARFFHERDRKTALRAKTEWLKRVAFHRHLGTMHDKMERTVELSIWICSILWRKGRPLDLGTVEAIARLAYADLVTEVVKEFPELQGSMGAYYARRDGERDRVALGVEEFYCPASSRGPLPSHLEGSVVALAARMDTLAAMFLAGLKPSGSEDPFALRRAGMGVLRLVVEKQMPISLLQLVAHARELVLTRRSPPGEALPEDAVQKFDESMRDFLWQRAGACFQEMGYAQDEIDAVEERALEDPLGAFKRLAAVHALRGLAEFGELATGFKRAANILKQAGVDPGAAPRVDRNLIGVEEERELHEALTRVQKSVLERVAHEDFQRALRDLVALKPSVDRFFETVRVMDAAENVRRNRLALLSELVALFRSVADISRIQVSASPAVAPKTT